MENTEAARATHTSNTDPSSFSVGLISTSDVASLAQVERPVVSVWKKRYAHSEYPFPQPALSHGGTDYFSVPDIAQWLQSTELGSNTEAALDAPLFTDFALLTNGRASHAMIQALVVLRAQLGTDLSQDPDVLVSDADDADPFDEFLFTEVEQFSRVTVGRDHAVDLVNAIGSHAFGAAHAVATLCARERLKSPLVTADLIAPALTELVVDLLLALQHGDEHQETGRILDLGSDHFDVIEQWLRRTNGSTDAAELLEGYPFFTHPDRSGVQRQTLRRFVASGVHPLLFEHMDDYDFPHVNFFTFISPRHSAQYQSELFTQRLLACVESSPNFTGIVVGPRDLLTGTDEEADRIRSTLVRDGVLRALCLLPQGLFPVHPREQLAMWILRKPQTRPEPSSKVYLADLTGVELESSKHSVISDVVAALESSQRRAFHYFGFQPISAVSGARVIDFPIPERLPATSNPADDVIALDQTLQQLLPHTQLHGLRVSLAQPKRAHKPRVTVAQAQKDRLLAVKVGHAIDLEWTSIAQPDAPGVRVIDKQLLSILAGRPHARPSDFSSRAIPAISLAQLDHIELTKPNDVVIVQHGKVRAAWVDFDGGNIVAHPLKVLRPRKAQLASRLVAQDINGYQSHPNSWRQWEIRAIPEFHAHDSAQVFGEIAQERKRLVEKLNALERIEAQLGDALARGGVRVALKKLVEN